MQEIAMSLSWPCMVVITIPTAFAPQEMPASMRAEYKAAADKEFAYGNLRKALNLAETACAISRENPGEWTSEHSDDLTQLARIQLELNDLKASTATMEMVLAI